MLGNREMMLAMLVDRESKVTACLTGDRITEFAKGLSEIAPGQIAGKASYGDDFLADIVQADDFGSHAFFKVTTNCLPDFSR